MKNLSLTRQLTSLTVILLFITALTTSLPASMLLHSELERQITLRMTTGEQHTATIWRLIELQTRQTVELASQRPTLQRLLSMEEWPALDTYLEAFRDSTPLDFLYIEDEERVVLAGIIPDAPDDPIFFVDQVLDDGLVVVGGIRIDAVFLEQLKAETGFFYQSSEVAPLFNQNYEARTVHLSDNIALVMLMDTGDVQLIQRSAVLSILTVALFAAGAGSLIGGFYLRRRIRPLWRLREAADSLGEGDLTSAIAVDGKAPEIIFLAETLEHSRQRIYSMMQQIQQERDWSNTLMQSIIEGIITVNSQGEVVFHSASTRHIMNWEADQIGVQVNDVFIRPDSDEDFLSVLPPEGGRKSIVVQAASHAITLSVTRARSLPDGEITLVLQDVTEETRHSNAQAYYLANMSHEFRTPLAGITASLELLTENDHSLARGDRQQLLNSLLMSVSTLQRLIDNLLEGSKLQAQKFSLYNQQIRFEQVVVDALHTMQPLLNRRQQPITLTMPLEAIPIYADRTRLVQVLVNLLSNASKYSPQSSVVDLTVTPDEDGLRVSVADHGEGIPEHQQESIFQQFVRLEQGAESDHSTGLGLWVVRGIIEAHGGKVGVESRKDSGSVFWFSIPTVQEGIA